jgi:hypothetical protein
MGGGVVRGRMPRGSRGEGGSGDGSLALGGFREEEGRGRLGETKMTGGPCVEAGERGKAAGLLLGLVCWAAASGRPS